MDYIYLTEQNIEAQRILIKHYEALLNRLPKGKLKIGYSGGRVNYYLLDEKTGKRKYLSDKYAKYIDELKIGRLLECLLKILRKDIECQEKMLKGYKAPDFSEAMALLPKTFDDVNIDLLKELLSKPAVHSERTGRMHPEQSGRIHMTSFGLKVRSKSEALIAELLHKEGITFIYEMELKLVDGDGNEHSYFPDFTILTKNDEIIYWEHFGMMDEWQYSYKAYNKLRMYFLDGIFPPDNLIITMESRDGEINMEAINREVQSLVPLCR